MHSPSRETGPAVYKRGKRRRLSIPPHFRDRLELEILLSSRYQRRYLRISAQQSTRIREQKRVRTVRGQRDTDRNIRHHFD